MPKAKKTGEKSELKVVQKKNGRFAVRKRGGAYLNGAEKVQALIQAGKIKAPKVKQVAPPASEEPTEA